MEMSYCSANTEKKFGFSNFRLYLIKKNRHQKKANKQGKHGEAYDIFNQYRKELKNWKIYKILILLS